MGLARFIVGDVLETLASLPEGSVDLVLTSPPFLALRNYLPDDHPDKDKEIGSEPTPADFLDALLDVVEACDRVLAPHGSLVFELGDTYSGSGGAGGDYASGGMREGQPLFRAGTPRWDGRPEGQKRTTDWPPPPPGATTSGGRKRADRPEGGSYGERPVPSRYDTRYKHEANGRTGPGRTRADREGWPLDKSLCGIPQAFELSLIWGYNILRPERETERWRVRNLAAWCRPNPPVGALSDKFRPGTSYLTIATKARDRYFDQDAVRRVNNPERMEEQNFNRASDRGLALGVGWEPEDEAAQNPAGAPPLDWWEVPEDPGLELDYWIVSPQGYKGSHYATWPTDLLHRPILAMCPERVCSSCGKPSRRITETVNAIGTVTGRRSWRADPASIGTGHSGEIVDSISSAPTADVRTLGWSHCGCGDGCRETSWSTKTVDVEQGRASDGKWYDLDEWPDGAEASVTRTKKKRKRVIEDLGECVDPSHWRRGIVLDPFAGSGTTLAVATGHGRDAIGIDLDERNVELARQRVGMFLSVEERSRA